MESKDFALHSGLVFARNHSVVYLEIGSQEFSAAVIGAMMLTMLAKVDKRLENFMLRWDDIDTPILR